MTDSVAIKRQHAWGRLYNAANAVAARIGADGWMSPRSPEISTLMDALAEIDGGQWCPGIMPIEQALQQIADFGQEQEQKPVAWIGLPGKGTPLITAPPASAAVPPGYALVPIEPTQEMLRAAHDVFGNSLSRRCYAQMIAAAGERHE